MVIFSVITPFYKGNRYMENLFHIVRENAKRVKQDIPEGKVELILVNDSPEEELVVPAGSDDISYRIIPHIKNQGIHQARVTGLMECSGDYILFLDQDDEVKPDFLSDQYRKMKDADIIIAEAFFEDAKGTQKQYYDKPGKIKKITELSTYLKSHNQIISPGQCLIRKRSIPLEWTENIMSVNGSDDLFLWILMFEKKSRFRINPECLYIHKYTGENLSESGEKMTRSSLDFVGYLKKIPYVSEKHIRQFERSRAFDLDMEHASAGRKIVLVLANADIVTHRILWKIRCL